MQRVLVTGGAGFIGANFVRYLLASRAGVRVVTLDALTYAGSRENLRGLPDEARHVFVEGSICDRPLLDRVLGDHEIDTVIHFAAESHVDRSIAGPSAFVDTNIVGTYQLLEAARAAWANRPGPHRFHHVSTDEVFGSLGPGDAPFSEATAYDPRSPYSASKAASDHLVRAWQHTYGLPITISNCTNNYGPYQFPEKLIPLMIFNALQGKALPIYGDGQQIRDWLHVADHCAAILAIVERGRVGDTYTVGGGNQPTNLEIVDLICDLLDTRFPDSPHRPFASLKTHVVDRPGHDRRYAMDSDKLQRELGWRAEHTLATGLSETVDWYIENAAWLAAIDRRGALATWLAAHYQSESKTS